MNKQRKILNDEMMKNIDSYANEIRSLKDFIEAVRVRPGMYIGPIGDLGFLNMIREIAQNAIDQLVSSKSPCDHIRIVYDMRTLKVRVEDNGLGIPFNDIERIYTTPHTSKNYDKKPGEYSSGLNGVGAKVTNALSRFFRVESYHYSGKAVAMDLEDGYIVKKPYAIPNKDMHQGTAVEFVPSEEILGRIELDWRFVHNLLRLILSLTDIGSVMYFEAYDKKGVKYEEKMVNQNGIITDLITKTKAPICKPIIIAADNGKMKADLAFCWASPTEKLIDAQGFTTPYSITSFSNWCPIRNDATCTPFSGFMDGISTWFTKYMNKIFLGEKSKITVTKNDCLEQLCAMVSVAHLYPEFTGQSKDIVSNVDFKPFVKETVMNGLDEWAKENPGDLQRVCKWIKDAASVRMKGDADKVKVQETFKKSVLTGLPDKYKEPMWDINKNYKKYEYELLIVEGDSAGGSAGKARKHAIQGVFPLRGKPKNPIGNTKKAVLENQEISGLVNILGAGCYGDFDINKVKFTRIIFLTDADADGAHICSLLILIFMVVFPGLIESGKVYKAVPPLFSIVENKKYKYFTMKTDYTKYKQGVFLKNNNIKTVQGKAIPAAQLLDIFVEFEEYVSELERISYVVDPELMEMVLYNYLQNGEKVDQRITTGVKKKYRFAEISYNSKTNTAIVSGLVNNKITELILNDRIMKQYIKMISMIQLAKNKFFYNLNGEVVSLYVLLRAFERTKVGSAGSTLSRYKGLGEMDSVRLAESTVHPDLDRTLIRLVSKDIHEETARIRKWESDKSKILAYVKSSNLRKSDIEK